VIDSTANDGARDHWPRRMEIDYLRLNNFAFGGINTPLIFRRV
jgi:3-oxoacyl-(acyl-carrier-protein) synthase